MIFVALAGGIGRLISAAVVGRPATPMVVFAAIEVPAVSLLQSALSRLDRVVRNGGAMPSGPKRTFPSIEAQLGL